MKQGGNTVVVTGGSSGIGRELVLRVAAAVGQAAGMRETREGLFDALKNR